jgi:hypothetical protein
VSSAAQFAQRSNGGGANVTDSLSSIEVAILCVITKRRMERFRLRRLYHDLIESVERRPACEGAASRFSTKRKSRHSVE